MESDRRGARYSALLLIVTGIALAGCVALAVGVTVRLVDVPRPRITADLSRVTPAAPDRTDLSLVDNLATSLSDLAAEDAAKVAAQRAARQQASRSKVRHHAPPADDAPEPTPSPTPTPPPFPDDGQPAPDHPDSPRFHPGDGQRSR